MTAFKEIIRSVYLFAAGSCQKITERKKKRGGVCMVKATPFIGRGL